MTDKTSVQPMDASKQNSPVAGPVSGEATVIMNKASETCMWNDQQFPDGAVVETDGVAYECCFGQWAKQS